MKRTVNYLLCFILCAVALGCSDLKSPSLNTIYTDYLAQVDVKKENFESALNKYYSLLETDGNRIGTHSNIGVLLSKNKKNEESLKSLQHALRLAEQQKNLEMEFTIRYNLGVYFGALKKVPEALENYQAALDKVPTSKEIKTNIELLLQEQQKDQQQKNENKDGDKKADKPSEGQNKDDKDNKGDDKNKKDEEQKEDDKKNQEDKDKKPEQDKKQSPKYQPRPFAGDQLSEGDVKKILGELRNQEQKIRANFDKKEKGKSNNNGKDW